MKREIKRCQELKEPTTSEKRTAERIGVQSEEIVEWEIARRHENKKAIKKRRGTRTVGEIPEKKGGKATRRDIHTMGIIHMETREEMEQKRGRHTSAKRPRRGHDEDRDGHSNGN